MTKFDRPNTLSRQIANHISEKIINGVYQNREQMKILELGKEYNVSQTTIREALQILEKTYLVENIPHKGFFVRTVQKEEIFDVWEIKKRLWGYAFRIYCMKQHNNPEVLNQLGAIIQELICAAETDDYERAFEKGFDMGTHIFNYCGSSQLRDILTLIEVQVKRFRYISIRQDNNLQETARLLALTLDAIQRNNPDEAESYTEAFIEMDRNTLLTYFENKDKGSAQDKEK